MMPESKFKTARAGCLGRICPCDKVKERSNEAEKLPGLLDSRKWSKEPPADSGQNKDGLPGLVDSTGRRWAGEEE